MTSVNNIALEQKTELKRSMEYNIFLSLIIITTNSMDLFCSSWVEKFVLFPYVKYYHSGKLAQILRYK